MAGIHRTPTSIAPSDGPLALPALDLNLLKVFAAVHHFCQVTAAARQLDMTPSAVSNALTRLRGHCGDALFVRTQRGVVPTPYANRLALAVSNGLNAFALGLQPDAPFTPASSERIFRVNVADVGQMLMIGSVMRSMGDAAPGIGIHTVDLPVLDVEAALMRGDLQFAVGHLSSMGKSLFRRKLVTEHFVCVVGAHNKRLRKRLTVEDFLDATHIRYSPAAASLSKSMPTKSRGRLWHMGISSAQRLAARTPATRAVLSTSPLALCAVISVKLNSPSGKTPEKSC